MSRWTSASRRRDLPPFAKARRFSVWNVARAPQRFPKPSRSDLSVMGDGGFWHNGMPRVSQVRPNTNDRPHRMKTSIPRERATGLALGAPETTAGQGGRQSRSDEGDRIGWISGLPRRRRTCEDAARRGADVDECLKSHRRRANASLPVTRIRRYARGSAPEDLERHRSGSSPTSALETIPAFLSCCPSLTVKPNEDPLRTDPVAHVNNDCVGCGLCGEVSHAAQLCPSFAEINVIENPSLWDRARHKVSTTLIRWFGGAPEAAPAPTMVPAE